MLNNSLKDTQNGVLEDTIAATLMTRYNQLQRDRFAP
jgi:hypothetical protein